MDLVETTLTIENVPKHESLCVCVCVCVCVFVTVCECCSVSCAGYSEPHLLPSKRRLLVSKRRLLVSKRRLLGGRCGSFC